MLFFYTKNYKKENLSTGKTKCFDFVEKMSTSFMKFLTDGACFSFFRGCQTRGCLSWNIAKKRNIAKQGNCSVK
jgi:hypothetical protein